MLVLVDGIRWVNESSASGVSGSADVNTIPLAIVERVEVLEDGASAIYGSDAIAGVVNIITRKKFDGAEVHTYYGEYDDGGDTTEASLTLGGSGERWSAVFGASYYEQKSHQFRKLGPVCVPHARHRRARRQFGHPAGPFLLLRPDRPTTGVGGCDADTENWYDITLDDGTTTPVFDPNDPNGGTYHSFSGADRFNFAPFNLLLTPSKRKAMFTSLNYDLTENTRLHVKGLYNNRTSTNQAAPEPIFVGPGAGTGGIADTICISRGQSVQPVRLYDLDAASNFLAAHQASRSRSVRASSSRTSTPSTSTSDSTACSTSAIAASAGTPTTCIRRTRPSRLSSTATTSPRSSSRSAIRPCARRSPAACRWTCSAARAVR